MAAIILGKNLLSIEELIEHAFSELNTDHLTLTQLNGIATDAAFQSSLLLMRMMQAERIYVQTGRNTDPSETRP